MLTTSQRSSVFRWHLSHQRPSVLAMLATLPLMGCAVRSAPVLSDRAVMSGYSLAIVQSLTGRTVTIEVHGDPFDTPSQAFAGQVAANMNDSAAAPARFAVHARANGATPYRVVWDFTPPNESLAPNAICQRRYDTPSKIGMPIDAYAAFCRGGEALSSVRGRLYYADTQNSLEFLNLIDVMTAQLFTNDVTGPRRSGDSRLGKSISHPF